MAVHTTPAGNTLFIPKRGGSFAGGRVVIVGHDSDTVMQVMVDPNAGMALFLSAHLDDAVFSCGGTLSLLQRHGWRTFVATVCTEVIEHERAGFADYFNLAGTSTVEAGLARRREEDRRAGRELGFLPLHLGLSDASFRQYYRLPEGTASMFIDPSVAAGDPYQAQMNEAIHHCIDRLQPDLIFAPAGWGDHVDHLLVRNACASHVRVATTSVIWYQDLPYGLAVPDATPVGLPTGVRPAVIAFDDEDLKRKGAASGAYASQVRYFPGPDWRGALERHARKFGDGQPSERVWRSDYTFDVVAGAPRTQ